jgi:hypothetical protein
LTLGFAIPLSISLIAFGDTGGDRKRDRYSLELLSILAAMMLLACSANNLHDVMWCGIYTEGYTIAAPGRGELMPFCEFIKIFGVEGGCDYRVLGCSMAIFGSTLATIGSLLLSLRWVKAPTKKD